MENVMTKGFCELSENEMMDLDGGDFKTGAGVFVGTLAIGLSPLGFVLCPPAGVGMFFGGLGVIGKATGAY